MRELRGPEIDIVEPAFRELHSRRVARRPIDPRDDALAELERMKRGWIFLEWGELLREVRRGRRF